MNHYRESFVVLPEEVDSSGFISIKILQKKIQSASDQHGYLLGFGFDDMNRIGLFWVVSRLMVEITSLPRIADEITIETWLEAPTSAGINRFYVLYDKYQDIMVQGMAKWSLVRRDTLKLEKMTECSFITNLIFESDSPHFKYPELKRIPRQNPLEKTQSVFRTVQLSEIDFNNHVNNTEYIQYMIDSTQPGTNLEMYQITYTFPLYVDNKIQMDLFESGNRTIIEGYVVNEFQEKQLSFQGMIIRK